MGNTRLLIENPPPWSVTCPAESPSPFARANGRRISSPFRRQLRLSQHESGCVFGQVEQSPLPSAHHTADRLTHGGAHVSVSARHLVRFAVVVGQLLPDHLHDTLENRQVCGNGFCLWPRYCQSERRRQFPHQLVVTLPAVILSENVVDGVEACCQRCLRFLVQRCHIVEPVQEVAELLERRVQHRHGFVLNLLDGVRVAVRLRVGGDGELMGGIIASASRRREW